MRSASRRSAARAPPSAPPPPPPPPPQTPAANPAPAPERPLRADGPHRADRPLRADGPLPADGPHRADAPPRADGSQRARLEVFEAWMRAHGVWLDPRARLTADAEQSAADVGVVAAEALSSGTTLCRIPKAATLSWRNSAAAAAIDGAGLRGAVATAIALTVERARGAASPWHGYLQLLPEREPLPLFWTDGDALTGTQAAALLASDRKQLRADYDSIVRPFYRRHGAALGLDAAAMTYDAFAAAASVVASRAFNVDRHHGQALVPLADMFNHRTGTETIHVVGRESVCACCPPDDDSDDDSSEDGSDAEDQGDPDVLEMELVADVGASDEVWNTYGELGNAQLLCKYGFAELDNPCDTVDLPAELVRAAVTAVVGDAQWKERWRFWKRQADVESEHLLSKEGTVPDGLLALVMTAITTPAAFAKWTDLAAVEAADAATIERMPAVRAVLLHACTARWAAYTDSSTSADELARLPALASRQARYAALVRIGEKRILETVQARLRTDAPAAKRARR